ncbi:MAG: SMP-30/gluconolactonase/LRE family protein [Bacteroidetes bacterium]|nr:SMP-30/gluconolactonase/LRE family protein [Bacteroidota bacterium]MBS1539644.1 SMP-30/gluconolactonase/LRE family protein [Bacteroidota bacterium]
MKPALLPVFLCLISFYHCPGQDFYNVKDLTSENLFTTNCEGPAVDKKGNLFAVNYQADGTIGQISADGKVTRFATLPEGSIGNAIQFDREGNMLVADFAGHNILKVDTKTKKVSVFVHSDAFNQPNDICINKKGQLFASDPNWKTNTGKIWRIDADGTPHLLQDNMGTTNGIELSPDEKTLYVNESEQRTLWAYDVDDKGNISNKRKLYDFPDFGMDGMKCDKEGNLLIARWGKGVIAIVSPQGKLIREVEMKGKKTSNICFGGKDGKTCFVTLQDRKCIESFRHEVAGRQY